MPAHVARGLRVLQLLAASIQHLAQGGHDACARGHASSRTWRKRQGHPRAWYLLLQGLDPRPSPVSAPTETMRDATLRNTFFAVLGLLETSRMWWNASENGALTLICTAGVRSCIIVSPLQTPRAMLMLAAPGIVLHKPLDFGWWCTSGTLVVRGSCCGQGHLVVGHHEADDDAHERVQEGAHHQAAHNADGQVHRRILHLERARALP